MTHSTLPHLSWRERKHAPKPVRVAPNVRPLSSAVKLDAPTIIIGNGGSGSSLLDRMLNAHPNIAMQGEMKFLIPRIWAIFWEADANSKLRNLKHHFETEPDLGKRITTSPIDYQNFVQALEHDEFLRTAAILRIAFGEWFCLGAKTSRHWGFKEIMNGATHYYSWDVYDYLFPKACWVHIVRHPLRQIRAQARLAGQTLTSETAKEFLNSWMAIVEMSRKRIATQRYFEIRYEDLIRAPKSALTPLFDYLGLPWHDDCRIPLTHQWGAKSDPVPLPSDINTTISVIPGLEECMTKLGYRRKKEEVDHLVAVEPIPVTSRLKQGGKEVYLLTGSVYREYGDCWQFDFSGTQLEETLASLADDIGFLQRSPLRLYENDKPLGPAHTAHFLIRGEGRGAFSHWQNRLLFSTSDNTNPNSNGRTYSFDLKG